MLMDASNLGTKVKLDEGQRTILSDEEKSKITTYFKQKKEEVEFSVTVTNDDIKENEYSIQAGQYIELKEEQLNFDIDERINILREEIIRTIDISLSVSNRLKEILNEV